MNFFVTGGAGFIASNLVDTLLATGHKVVAYDNLSLGRKEFLQSAIDSGGCRFVEADLLDHQSLLEAMNGCDAVFHLAANSDISHGAKHTDWDLNQGTFVTWHVLEAMRELGIRKILFASSSAIYGEASQMPTSEAYGPLFPISLYGASKLACEALITAFCHNFDFQCWIYRFANIVGRNGTHGVIVDFIKRLMENPDVLTVLGDGRQAKPYIEVNDCVDAILFGFKHLDQQVNCMNLACEGATSVSHIAKIVLEELGLTDSTIEYTGGNRGWRGDVAQVRLDPTWLKEQGWVARYDSDGAVRTAVKALVEQIGKGEFRA
jgi:UDP-glucose 4-epimerase